MTTSLAALEKSALTLSALQAVSGYRFGLRQPCLLAKIEVNPDWIPPQRLAEMLWLQALSILPERYHGPLPNQTGQPVAALLAVLVRLVGAMQDSVGLPVVSEGRVLPLGHQGNSSKIVSPASWLLALPSFSSKAAELALRDLLRVVRLLIADTAESGRAEEEVDHINGVLDAIGRLAPSGTNTHRLLRTALQRQIPMINLPGGVWQFGWGSNGRLFKSSLSDETSAIGTGWAKDKIQANQILRMAGLPVPEQVLVQDLDMALQQANRIGYPVVLKPADLDQGVGVEAGLASNDDLRAAYQRVSSHRRRVLLEQHIDGRDVRVNILRGKFQDAIARYPAGVKGDGRSSISELIDAINQDPRRSTRRFSDMKPITISDEARALIAAQGYSENSIPEPGQFVRLRRAANVSSGGTTKGVTEELHPDNVRLCERAARLLRLDIAGIDLLIPDHSKSWRAVGGAICEVNAQPQIGLTYPQIYERLFDAFLNGQGRIPIVLVLTDDASGATALMRQLEADRESDGPRVVMNMASLAGNETARSALIDPNCRSLIIVSDGYDLSQYGVAVDRIDLLWIATWTGEVTHLRQRLSVILPQLVPGEILLDEHLVSKCNVLKLPLPFAFRAESQFAAVKSVQQRLCVHRESKANAGST